MPQHGRDGIEPPPGPQPRRRRRVTEHVRTLCRGIGDARPLQSKSDDVGDRRRGGERTNGRVGAQEAPIGIGVGARASQGREQGLPSVLGQGETNLLTSLALDTPRGRLPIEIGTLHGHDVCGAKTEPSQEEKDGTIPHAMGRAHIAGGDQALDVRRFEVARPSR